MGIYAEPPPPILNEPTGIQYQTEKQLGRGGFAICWQAQQTDNGRTPSRTIALKVVKSRMDSMKLAQKFVTELQLHSKLNHPNIVEFHRAFSYQSSTYVVLEICANGSLTDCLRKRSYLSMPEIRRYIIQICGAVKYLHMRNIVHRDLKAGNLFLDYNMNVKVGDFGLAAVLVGPNDIVTRRTTMCGTPSYIAPEVLERSGKGHNEKVDIWAIGIIAYTLAVGKAPFHASKPEKILVNVAKGEYAWPEVGKHANAIPDDLHNLVSQILVDETSRPSLDAIVSHDFLKIGFVPDTLGREAISCMPEWPVNLANTAIVKQGYSKGWYKQCKASGVGEYAPGKFFSLVGDSTCGSIYRECEREAEAGKMPLIPIPDGFFYIPFVSEEGEGSVGGLQDMKDVELISSHKIQAPVKTKKNIADTVKIIPRQEQGLELRDSFPPMPSIDMPPASSCTSIRRVSLRSASRRAKLAPQETLIPAPAPAIKDKKAQPEPIINERGPRGPFRTRSIQIATRTTSRTTAQPEVEPTEPTKPIQTTSCNTARANAYQSEAVQSTCTTSNTHSRTAASKATTLGSLQVPMAKDTTQVSTSELLILPSTRFTSLELQERTTSKGSPINVYTNLTTILTRVEELRNNIAAALESRYNASAALYNWNSPTDQLPFVSKWVDYSKKYGIGYILADGRVGLVANSTDDKPLTHTVVDDGCKYLKINYSKTSLDTVPFVFFTQADDGRLEEETMSEADRKQNGILWAKFGRYMCNNMNDPIPTGAGRQEEGLFTIVRYYQRLGNVSVWGFSNGCFQFNFPDHTKIVLSADGKYMSFTTLPLSAITQMNTNSTNFPLEALKTREVFSGTIHQLLYGITPTRNQPDTSISANINVNLLELTTANALTLKLHFVAELMGHWISGGGLGCKPKLSIWPEWEGMALDKPLGCKLQWVTVGGFGKDRIPIEKKEKGQKVGQYEGEET